MSEAAVTCPSCGADIPGGARFCPSCGAALAETAAPDEMLKLVTVLFADVVGSTARAEQLHPEDVRAAMSDYFGAMAKEIEAEGGTVEKFIGDAVMAVFGVPTAHEDDPVRGVRAARRMLERLATWNEERSEAERLEIRIGLSTGDVVASGAPGGDLLVTGDPVNVAARLQQNAEPGTILVGDRTARAARSHFELRPIEPLELKGKSEAVAAWVVEGERDAPEPRGVPGLAAPLVGRDHELAALEATFDRVRRERRPELVTLVGDAGIGKSRLVREFLSPLETEARVLVGRCLPYGQGVTLWPLAEMLKAEAVVLDTDGAEVAFGKIAQLVATGIDSDLAGDPARTAAALASTLGLRPADDPLAALDPRELYRELLAAWRALLASVARDRSVVVLVEDIHWADATMLDVLDELAERLEGPVLLLCTARPDLLRVRPDWGGGRRGFSSLPLDPLSSEESARLVSALLDVDELPEAIRRRILERSEGNPFFLEEIVRRLIDDGLLAQEDGLWRARAGIEDVEIPDNVHAVILARLDLLSPEEKRVAQRAAVVGRVFWDGAVALAEVEDLDGVLRTLRRREFVVERLSSSIAGQAEYAFKHVLIRDVAYESLPRRERGRAHIETAAWIERTSGERKDELAELLAYHYEAAYSLGRDDELRQKARSSFLTAAQNNLRRFAIEQAERLVRRGVELSKSGPERVETLEALGDTFYVTFNGDGAYGAYREALGELTVDDADFARLAAKTALFGARWTGASHELAPVDEVEGIIESGLAAAGPGSEPERALLLVNRGFLLAWREQRRDREAETAVREAVRAAEELDDPDVLSAALDLVEAWEKYHGRPGEAYRATQRRLDFVPRMTDVKEIGDACAMGAEDAFHLGRYAESEASATAGIERSRGVDSGSYVHGLTWRVAARFMLGKWDEALADQADLEGLAGQDPRELPAGYTLRAYAFRALCHELRGEREEADRYVDVWQRYFDVFVANRRRTQSGTQSQPVALVFAHRGRFDDAVDAIPYFPCTLGSGLTLQALCEIVAARGDWAGAARIVAAAREEAETGEQVALPLYADRLEGRIAATAGDSASAVSFLARSADGFAALGARWEEAWSRLLLAEVLGEGERRGAHRELRAALPVFEDLRSMREAERARALLAEVAA